MHRTLTILGCIAISFSVLVPQLVFAQAPGADMRADALAEEQLRANQCHRLGSAGAPRPCAKGPCPENAGAACVAVPCNDPAAFDCGLLDYTPSGGSINPTFKFQPVNAVLQIPIPNLQFSNILHNVRNVDGKTDVVSIPWIGEYIAAIYRWSIPVGAMLTVIAIMIGGIIWLTSAGAERLSAAKTWITNAVIGLLILVCSYVILNIINPDLVNLTQLSIRLTKPEQVIFSNEPDSTDPVEGAVPTSIVTLTRTSTNNIIGEVQIDQPLLQPVLDAAAELGRLQIPIKLSVTSGYRSVEKQLQLIKENCQNPPGSDRCNPRSEKPVTCILRKGLESCPHTTGHAVDAWGVIVNERGREIQCISMKDCLSDPNACRNNPCQTAVIEAMRSNGFCNWTPEPWHFEKPGMSKPCV